MLLKQGVQEMRRNGSMAVTIEMKRKIENLFRKQWFELGDGLDWGWLVRGNKGDEVIKE